MVSQPTTLTKNDPACTLHVCTSCRPSGFPREPMEERPGFKLFKALERRLKTNQLRHQVSLQPAECLSLCKRSCGIALSSPGAWTYLFGDQDPDLTAQDILDCVSIYLDASNGQMTRDMRPEALRASILGRVPPALSGEDVG
ncbi:MAG: DUF1636 domain-containing protein [Pseudomonadales bacterium]|nr:DUF1636 domain-containing protein [Pseudomonadales bacterium]MBO6594623.1 DUF1636 domain-containing protein [Pseudomonadales bacterium]MBO6655449.1 DUF1636 domain-containing protein [Pseudomonadales bacterium]MBO6821817.1 DUF1636 domain-containing protein [Pseudomonadales bacterium]